MRYRLIVMAMLMMLIVSSLQTIAQSYPECPPSMGTPYMIAGSRGRVLPGNDNRIRSEPSILADVVGTIPAEAEFQVVSDPACVDNFIWWQVIYDGIVGWTAERDRDTGEAWIEPTFAPNEQESVDFMGISLTYDAFRTSLRNTQVTERGLIGADHAIREFRISLGDVILEDAVISVFSLKDYADLAPVADEEVNALLDMLDSQTFPEGLEEPPNVPIVTTARPFQAAPEFINFQNGRGVRYVTTYAQNTIVVIGYTPIYEFMGVTNDGQWLVTAKVPITTGLFPTMTPDEVPYTDETYLDYLRDVEARIDNANNYDFHPRLPVLDSMIESLLVEPRDLSLGITPEDVSYVLPESIAPSLIGEVLDVEPFSTFSGESGPPVLRFAFGGQATYMANNVMIYPVALTEELGILNFDELRRILDERPSSPDVPYFPRTGTGRFFEIRPEYIDFQNGSGVRYLADFLQEIDVFVPDYIFVGLTDDNAYYVIVSRGLELPALRTSPDLEPYNQMLQSNYTQFMEEFDTYQPLALNILETAPAEDFVPSLNDFDDFVRSLRIGGN